MEKSNYALYREEREGATVIETEQGFAAAIPFGDYWYLDEIFVKKEHRKSNIATTLADQIVKIGQSKDYKYLLGSVDIRANGANESIKVLLAYNMKIHEVQGNIIYFIKDI
jgi:ribosomal protein S18 acetylase RimI-like enzyme